jgi:L-threonylcarbamoyladenylate synthase
LRSPRTPITQAILQGFGDGLAAPSANRFGQISPTLAKHVEIAFQNKLKLIVDGGPCDIGVESTILDLSQNTPRILRPGMISAEAIESVLHQKVLASDDKAPRVSGSLPSHYAPHTPSRLVTSDEFYDFVREHEKKMKLAIIARLEPPKALASETQWITLPATPAEYAKVLYAWLHACDALQYDLIVIEEVPAENNWLAVHDRLKRACSRGL